MFGAKKIDKWVNAGIISPAQKNQILDFENKSNNNLIIKAFSLLGIFTIGVGVISIVASNWYLISKAVKLVVMFLMLLGVAGSAVYAKEKGKDSCAEKLLLLLFFLCGAAIGLVIQVYHLSGGDIHVPLGFWCLITSPLLVIAQREYVAKFWVPLFLSWVFFFFADVWIFFSSYELEKCMVILGLLMVLGKVLDNFIEKPKVGKVLYHDAFVLFYILLAFYILWISSTHLFFAALFLIVSSLVYYQIKDYKKLQLNIKFAGLEIFCLYIYLGNEIGLFSTGIGLIISGVVLVFLVNRIRKVSKKFYEEKKND